MNIVEDMSVKWKIFNLLEIRCVFNSPWQILKALRPNRKVFHKYTLYMGIALGVVTDCVVDPGKNAPI